MQKRQRRQKRAQEKARSIDLSFIYAAIFGFIFLAALIFSTNSFGDAYSVQHLRNLEKRIWTSPDTEIQDLQIEVTQLIQKRPKSAFAHYLLGQLYIRQFVKSPYEMHLLRQAAELGQQSIDLKPKKDFGYIVASQVLDMMGYTSNALKLVDPTRNVKIKDTWRTQFLRAKFNAAQSNFEVSLDILRSALKEKNSQKGIIIPHVLALIESNLDGSSLIKELRSWSQDFKEDQSIKLNLAIALTRENEHSKAHKVYESILKKEPSFIEASINNSIILYQNLERPGEGQKRLLSILKSQEQNLSEEQEGIIKGHLAKISLSRQDYQTAEQLLLSVIVSSTHPLEWIAFSHQTYKERKLFAQFSSLIQKVKMELPGSGPVYALHGEVLSEYLADHEAAINSYEGAILLEPSKSEFYNGLGLAYYRQKDMSKALSSFIQASQVDPNDATARYNEACVLSILGRSQEALGSLKEAINLDPRLLKTAKSDNDFNNIKNSDQFKTLVEGNQRTLSELERTP